MPTPTRQFCSIWRQKTAAADPSDPEARQRLNAIYSALVKELRAEYHSSAFASTSRSVHSEGVEQSGEHDLSWRLARLERKRISSGDPAQGLKGLMATGLDHELTQSVLSALLPVYIADGKQLLELSLKQSWSYEDSSFLDAAPIAEILLEMPKTRLVNEGVRVDKNTLYPDDVYRRLAKHRNSTPKSEVAQCLHAPLDVLEDLAGSSSKEIIYPLARNPMTPLPVLHSLLKWNGWGAKTVAELVRSSDAFRQGEAWQLMEMGRVLTAVDQRKRAVLETILDLLQAHETVAEALRLFLHARLFPAWRFKPEPLRLQMINNQTADHNLLITAAWSWNWQERLAVASSPVAPKQALDKLCKDGLPTIRQRASKMRSLCNQL